ncbi:MAG TPA: hypothetical protein VM029_16950, partial [Opitutaceae bacterium]|nr:hypothetical protein [Opitutaceae bacterium]
TLRAAGSMGTGTKTVSLTVQGAVPANAPARIVRITPPDDQTYNSSLGLGFTVYFSQPVAVTGFPRLPVTVGNSVRYATWGPPLNIPPSYTQLGFSVHLLPSDFDPDGIALGTSLDLNGGTIKDANGNDVNVSFTAPDLRGVRIAPLVPSTPRIVQVTQSGGVIRISGNGGNETVVISRSDTGVIGSVPAGQGNWSFDYPSSSLPAGTYTFTAQGRLNNATVFGEVSPPVSTTIAPSPTNPPPAVPPPPPPPPPPPSVVVPPPVVNVPPPLVRQTQTVAFNSPVSGFVINQPVTLGATASSGLPITYSIVAGQATLNGNVLTATGPGVVIVRAAQAGNASYSAASADVNFGAPQKAGQAISFAALADVPNNSRPINLAAAASSGLPITYTVSGPATLTDGTIVLNGAAGVVTVRATQAGNDSYNGADVVRSFAVQAVGPQVYFGTLGADEVSAVVARDNASGTLLVRRAATAQAHLLRFILNPDGTFAAPNRAFSGRVVDGVMTGFIAGNDTPFHARVQVPTGPTATLAGMYVGNVPGSASDATYLVLGPHGQAYALATGSLGSFSGTGTVSADGNVDVALGGNASVKAIIAPDGRLTGTLTLAGIARTLVGLAGVAERTDRIVNVSSRLRVTEGDGSRAVIAGFVVTGSAPKQILVRAVGPGLARFGVGDTLSNPKLELYDVSGKVIAENDDWTGDAAVWSERVGAFALTAGSRDAAVIATVSPGAYTARVTGGSGSGVVLIEVYDTSTDSRATAPQLVNISTRGYVDTGAGELAAGFVVTGNAPKRVLIRGIGPGLTAFGVPGVLNDPVLQLYTPGTARPIAQNDNWEIAQPIDAAQIAASRTDIVTAGSATGAFPLTAGAKDAVLVITLLPGNYSAVLSGVNGSVGAGLIEVYQLPSD